MQPSPHIPLWHRHVAGLGRALGAALLGAALLGAALLGAVLAAPPAGAQATGSGVSASSSSPMGAAQPLVVRIGHAAPTRGWLARVGLESQNAARLAVETLNQEARTVQTSTGRVPLQFALVTADDAGEPTQGENAAHQLVGAGVSAVVGHLLTDHTLAAAPVYARAGIPQLTPSSTGTAFTRRGWPTAFRLLADDARLGTVLAREVARAWPGSTVVLVEDGSAQAGGLAASFAAEVEAAGSTVLGRLRYAPRQPDWPALIARLQALRPDVLLFGGLDREAGLLLQALRRARLAPLFVGGDPVCTPDLVSYWAVGAAEDGQVLCALPAGVQPGGTAASDAFIAAYTRRFGTSPEFYGAHAHDAVMLVADAVRRADSADPARLRDALAATPGLEGITGRLCFDARGEVREPAVSLFTYRHETRVPLRTVR